MNQSWFYFSLWVTVSGTMTKVYCMEPISSVCRILMKEGLLPSDREQKMRICSLTFHTLFFAVTLFLIVMNGVNAIKVGNGLMFIYVACIFIPIANLWIKEITILQKKECFLSLLDHLRSHDFNNHSAELNRYIRLVLRASNMMLKCYVVVVTAYVFVMAVLPLALDTNMMIPPPFEMKKYLLAYKLFHIGVSIYLALNTICFDVLFVSFLGLCIAQLHILEKRLIYVFEEAGQMCEENNSSEINLYEEMILKFSIVLHKNLTQYVDKLNVILSFPLLIQYLFGCFIICSLVIQLTILGRRNTTDLISIIAYGCATFSQMLIYHWLGNEITFKSGNVVNACYSSKWYKLHIRSKKNLIILMERAKRPLVVQLYKLVFISLESLGVIVRWSYSLLALIKARYN